MGFDVGTVVGIEEVGFVVVGIGEEDFVEEGVGDGMKVDAFAMISVGWTLLVAAFVVGFPVKNTVGPWEGRFVGTRDVGMMGTKLVAFKVGVAVVAVVESR